MSRTTQSLKMFFSQVKGNLLKRILLKSTFIYISDASKFIYKKEENLMFSVISACHFGADQKPESHVRSYTS